MRSGAGSEEPTISASQNAPPRQDRSEEPLRGSPLDAPGQDGQGGDNQDEVLSNRVSTPEPEPEQPAVGRNSLLEAAQEQELETLRTWLRDARAREELRSLQELRTRYEAGDVTAVLAPPAGRSQGLAPTTMPSVSLPRPEPPKEFTKRNRAEFNRWERECEGYFTRSPAHFQTERQKVDFGIMYVSEPLKTLWESNCVVNSVNAPGWVPTWVELKAVMLNSMGTPQERRKLAYDKLKACRQQQGRTPTDLLDYMRPLWEELGSSITPEMQLLEYSAALRSDIQAELERLPLPMRCTIPMVEEQANIVYRRKNQTRDHRDQPAREKHSRRREASGEPEGNTKTLRNAKKPRSAHSGPKRAKAAPPSAPAQAIVCYKCGEPGHRVFECTNPAKPGFVPRAPHAGKEKGLKT
jgi:hypothetical protein